MEEAAMGSRARTSSKGLQSDPEGRTGKAQATR